MFGRSLIRTGLLLCKQDSFAGAKCVLPALNAGDQRHGASSSAAVLNGSKVKSMDDGNKLKTMDDLDGPSFMTSLYWLFGKGYFQTTHQMQVC